MDQKEVDLFQSDFRVVADYFVQKQENGDYEPKPQDLKHVQETLQLLSVMTNDHRFEDVYNEASDGGPYENPAYRESHRGCEACGGGSGILRRADEAVWDWLSGLICNGGLRKMVGSGPNVVNPTST